MRFLSSSVNDLRQSRIGGRLRALLQTFPHYQQLPDGTPTFVVKQKLNVGIHTFVHHWAMDPADRLALRLTRRLRRSEDRCALLIASGPSSRQLTHGQVSRLRLVGAAFGVMNDFYKTEQAKFVSPDYYFVVDPSYTTMPQPELVDFFVRHPNMIIIQQSGQPRLSQVNKTIRTNPFMLAGLSRNLDPTRPSSYPESVALTGLAFFRYLGFSPIYVTGLDSNMYMNYFVDYMNQLYRHDGGMHSYSRQTFKVDRLDPLSSGAYSNDVFPVLRNMSDVLYAHAIFLRDLRRLGADVAVNVGDDHSNDSLPRACLIQ